MTTPRARAGQPYVPPMDCSGSGCNGPKEGDCLGFCTLHRVPPPMPIQFAGPEPDEPVKEQKPEPGLIAGFLGIFKKEWK